MHHPPRAALIPVRNDFKTILQDMRRLRRRVPEVIGRWRDQQSSGNIVKGMFTYRRIFEDHDGNTVHPDLATLECELYFQSYRKPERP